MKARRCEIEISLLERLSLKSLILHGGIKLNLGLKIRLRPMCWTQVFGVTFDESHQNKSKSVRRG